MNYLKYYAFLTLLFVFQNIVKSQSISYKTENYTHNLAPFKLSISFLNFENILTPITAGVMVEGHVKDKLFYNAQFRQGYIRNFMVATEKLITTQAESNGTYFEAGVDWVFADKIKKGKLKIVTSSSFNGSSTSQTYFKADCEARRYFALSGGVIQYIRPKYINSDSSEYIVSNGVDKKAPNDKFTHFNQSTSGLYVGITKRKIRKVIVKADDGYNYRAFYSTKFYLHALVGTTSIDDIIINNQSFKIDNAKQNPVGYRMGWQWDQMGVTTGFEFGNMPGVTLETPIVKSEIDNLFKFNPFFNYMRLTFHFSIFNNDKNFYIKNKK